MAVLNKESIKNRAEWEAMGIELPRYDYEAMRAETQRHPKWVHVGAGNIFRAYIADLAQTLLNDGKMTSGITVLSTFDHQILSMIYDPCDDLSLQVIMHADGHLDKKVIASVGETMKADFEDPAQWPRCKEVFADPGLQMVSFTITEKGYQIRNMKGEFYPAVLDDFERKTEVPQNGMAIIAALLLHRFENGAAPIAIVSMDNFSHNGEKLYDSVSTIAKKWVENGKAPAEFLEYLADDKRVAFPCSMIDKITPRPDATVAANLRDIGFESTEAVVTDKNTYIAPFVNAEAPQYLVIEDKFPNGRPPLDKVGVMFCDRETVNKVERMKVTTCLNPLHTAMSVNGCLLGYTKIADEMKDADIVTLVKRLGYVEGLPVVTDPGIIKPKDFLDEVVEQRLPNVFMPDDPRRIATDTSQKVGVRFGETIKSYLAQGRDLNSLVSVPLALAGWMRYLLGINDEGQEMEVSDDPLKETLQAQLQGIVWNDPASYHGQLRPILSNASIFGVDLTTTPLAEKIEKIFVEELAGPGAVRATLKKYLAE